MSLDCLKARQITGEERCVPPCVPGRVADRLSAALWRQFRPSLYGGDVEALPLPLTYEKKVEGKQSATRGGCVGGAGKGRD